MYNIKNCSIPDHFFKDPETGYCLECIELLAAKVQEEYSAKDEIFVLNSIKNPTKTLARQFKYPEALVIADKAIQFFSQAEEIYFDLGDDLKRRNSYFEIRNRKKQNEAIENCYYEGRLLAGVLANLLEQKCIILLLIIYPLDIMNLYQETEAFKFAYQAMRKYLYVNEGLEHQQREEQLTQEQMLLELINYHNLIISQNKDTIMNFQMKSIDIINEVWPYKMILKMQKIKQLAKEDEAYECCEVGLIKYPKNKMLLDIQCMTLQVCSISQIQQSN